MKNKWRFTVVFLVFCLMVLTAVASGLQKVERRNNEVFLQRVSLAILNSVHDFEKYIEEPNQDRSRIVLLNSYLISAELNGINRAWYVRSGDKELAQALIAVSHELNTWWWNHTPLSDRSGLATDEVLTYMRSVSAVIQEHFISTREEQRIDNKKEAARKIAELTSSIKR